MYLNINSDELVMFTNKLEKLRKSALPAAVMGTLNGTAFNMKTVTMPKHAKQMFEQRQPNFFKANSKVDPAKGYDINKMVSIMGFVSSGLHNQITNFAVKDLEQQENAGTIHGRSYKPLEAARRGGTGNVRANARISAIRKGLIDARQSKFTGTGKNGKMQQFIKASIHAGVGRYVLATSTGKGGFLFQVTGIKRIGRNTKFSMKKLFTFKKSGVAKVHATHFTKAAADEVRKQMEALYIKEATRQVNKVLK